MWFDKVKNKIKECFKEIIENIYDFFVCLTFEDVIFIILLLFMVTGIVSLFIMFFSSC